MKHWYTLAAALSIVACSSKTDDASGTAGSSGAGGTGNGGTGGASASGGGPAVSCTAEPEHTGEGTYYDADGSGNCSFDPSPDDLMVGAMNEIDYAGSVVCGACAHIDGPNGAVDVRVVDRCPECPQGDIDLSPQAFEQIAPLVQGRVPIRWRFQDCNVSGPIRFRFKEGSNQWWTAVQIRNHRNRVAKLEYDDGSTFREVARETYNYFVAASGMGPGPYRFRVTDVYGNQLVEEGIEHREAEEVPGTGQFPACTR